MRPSCLDCVRKHLGQAAVLIDEVAAGYTDYKWLVVGHLAEAEAESMHDWADLAYIIRERRLLYMSTDTLSVLPLIKEADRREKDGTGQTQ